MGAGGFGLNHRLCVPEKEGALGISPLSRLKRVESQSQLGTGVDLCMSHSLIVSLWGFCFPQAILKSSFFLPGVIF